MKRVLLSLTLSLFTISLFSQVLLQQDFSAGQMPPMGWMVFGNTANWVISQTNDAGGEIPEAKVKSTPAFNGTMRFISPNVNTTGQTMVIIQFKHMFDHSDANATPFTIAVDTRSSNGAWHNVWSVASTTDIGSEIVTIPVNNSDVGSSTFQFCLYVTGTSLSFNSWFFDDIFVLDPLPLDAGMAAITIPSSFVGSQALKGKFVNVGETPLTSIDVNWMAVEGEVHTTSLSGLNVTTGNTYEFTSADSVTLDPGVYDLKVWVSGVNGQMTPDDNPANDTLVKNVAIPIHMTYRRPMFEEFTSSTCGPCASFNSSTFNPFIEQHGDEITLVKYQMNWPGSGDPYYTAEGGVRRNYYGVNAVPDLYTDGKVTNTNSSAVNTAFNTSKNTITYIEIESQHEIQGNNVIIDANVIPYANYNNVTVYIVVFENVTTQNVATNGETEFHHVMMKMVPDAYGTSTSLNANQPFNLQFTVDMSSTFVEEMDDLGVAIFVQDNSTKEIYQSGYSQETGSIMNITPADGSTNVSVTAPMMIEYHQPVRLSNGQPITNDNVASLVTLKENGGMGPSVPFTATINTSKTLITITPDTYLKSLHPYLLKMDVVENYSGVATLPGESHFTSEISTVGMEKPLQSMVRVYPNPTSGLLNIELNDAKDVNRIELVNAMGMVVRKANYTPVMGDLIQWDMRSVSPGIYYVRLAGNDSQQVFRVTVSR